MTAKSSCRTVLLVARSVFQRLGVCQLISLNIPGHSHWTSHKHHCMPHRSFCPPLVQHVEEPVAHDWVGVDFAAFCRAAAGLVFNKCSGGRGGTRSAGVGDLLVCDRSSDGVSWLPPARPLQADTMSSRMVVEDVLLQSTFPEQLPRGVWRTAAAWLVANSDQQTGR